MGIRQELQDEVNQWLEPKSAFKAIIKTDEGTIPSSLYGADHDRVRAAQAQAQHNEWKRQIEMQRNAFAQQALQQGLGGLLGSQQRLY